jgi:hypothetical protein
MNTTAKNITKDVEELQKNLKREEDFQERVAKLEGFYQEMLAAGIARKEDYNVVSTGIGLSSDFSFLLRA